MSRTLASVLVTETLHLIRALLISQLRLTGPCGYLSAGFVTQITAMPSKPQSETHRLPQPYEAEGQLQR